MVLQAGPVVIRPEPGLVIERDGIDDGAARPDRPAAQHAAERTGQLQAEEQ
ncbi:hypothetical protein ACKI2N_024145 [Cupriavidus sp. 30B13]|uniref:hypothetical protein n=1 Tax=Cupriavidus sp. 30B13 TaxID=3384241 RepID=UPI003B8F8A07